MRTSVRVGAIVVVAAFLGACSSSSSKSSGTTPSKPTPAARGAPRSSAELDARIVSKPPSGFVRQADDVGDTGPSDLAKAIRDQESDDGGKDLRAEEFVRGYQRLWIGPGHAQIIVFVNQFASQSGARRNFARVRKGFDTKPPPGIHKFTVSFLPAAQVIAAAGNDKGESASFVEFTSGVFGVEIVCNGPALPGLQAQSIAIAENQFRRL
jgi:hypothetical protein